MEHGAYGTGRNTTDWSLDKIWDIIYFIFKMAPAHHEDYLVANDLYESHKPKNVSYLFAQTFVGIDSLKIGSAKESN